MLASQAQVISADDGVGHIVRAVVDVSVLAPGEYVARAIITAAGSQAGEVTRGCRVDAVMSSAGLSAPRTRP